MLRQIYLIAIWASIAFMLAPAIAEAKKKVKIKHLRDSLPGTVLMKDALSDEPILTFITTLSDTIEETSGLAYFAEKGEIWTHNDSGNDNVLYLFDTLTGHVVRQVRLSNAPNRDWEALAQDDTYLYVCDVGNNFGNRRDLTIYKVLQRDIRDKDTVSAEAIRYSYPNQTDFSPANRATNFDCEAVIFFNDSLHLFSKNWGDGRSKHYVLPTAPGTYTAEYRGEFDARGLITAADINEKGNLVLIGYTQIGQCFAWLISGYEGSNFFEGTLRRINLPSALFIGQIEGIAFGGGDTGWISAEAFFGSPARLHRFNFTGLFERETKVEDLSGAPEKPTFALFPNPASSTINLRLLSPTECLSVRYSIYKSNGKHKASGKLRSLKESIDITGLSRGLYLLSLDVCGNVETLFFNVDR